MLFLVLVFFLFFSSTVSAQAPVPGAGLSITLSEISACESGEWIEIYNSTDTAVDLSNWKIEKSPLTEPPSWSARSVQVASISAKMYLKIWEGSSTLSNDGFVVQIKDAAGEVVEKKSFEKCPSTTAVSWIKEGEDWKLTKSMTPNAANTYLALATPTPTPTTASTPSPTPTPTSTPTPTPSPTSTPGPQPTTVSLSEVYACQSDGTREWVELMNSGNTSVTLSNWKLTDDDNNDQPIPSLTIAANGYVVVEITKYARGMLTNDGDVVTLYDANGKKVDTFEYDTCSATQSWAKSSGAWAQTEQLTKGSANLKSTPLSTPTPLPEGDGDDPIEGTPPGVVLGAAAADETPAPDSESSTQTAHSTTTLALASIGVGSILLLTMGGILAWEPYLKTPVYRLLKRT